MNARLSSFQLTLNAHQPLSIEEAQAIRVRVLEGVVWITEEGCSDDFFVKAGEMLLLRGSGRAVLLADQEARLELIPATPVSIHSPGLWFQLATKLTTLFGASDQRAPGGLVAH